MIIIVNDDNDTDDENVGDINASRVNRVPPVAFSPHSNFAHFNQHLYDDEFDDQEKYDKDGDDDCQGIWGGIRVQNILLIEIRFVIETPA